MLSVTSTDEILLTATQPTWSRRDSQAWKLSICSNRTAAMTKWPLYPRLGIRDAGQRQQSPTVSAQAFESDRILMSAKTCVNYSVFSSIK